MKPCIEKCMARCGNCSKPHSEHLVYDLQGRKVMNGKVCSAFRQYYGQSQDRCRECLTPAGAVPLLGAYAPAVPVDNAKEFAAQFPPKAPTLHPTQVEYRALMERMAHFIGNLNYQRATLAEERESREILHKYWEMRRRRGEA